MFKNRRKLEIMEIHTFYIVMDFRLHYWMKRYLFYNVAEVNLKQKKIVFSNKNVIF